MNQKYLLVILSIIIVGIAIAVGLSMFAEQEKLDKEAKDKEDKAATVTVVQEQKPRVIAYYRCFDFGLPAGTVIRFSPSDNSLDALSEDEARKKDIYIHIQQDDGSIRVEKCTYETWIKLCIGDILK
jgi:hypothetical protein